MAQINQQQNLKVSYNYISWIFQNNRAILGHFYTLTSATGEIDTFTDLDTDVTYQGVVYKGKSLRFEGLQRKIGVGLSVDEQTLKIWASPTDTLWGSNFLSGAEQGLLDGATIVRSRGIWPIVTGNASYDLLLPPIGFWTLYTGYTSQIAKGGATHIELKVKSALLRLNLNMPRNYYQPGCLWTLFDAGCTLNKASFAATGTVGPGISNKAIPVAAGIVNPVSPDGLATYAQGRLLFTSGVNAGLQVLVDNNTEIYMLLAYPLDDLPAEGDDITFFPGCSKTFATCGLKYSNTANFRGFDKVPPIQVSM